MKWTRRIAAATLGYLVLNTTLLSASARITEPKLMDRVTPVAAGLLLNAYRYIGGLKQFSIDAVTTSDDLYQDKMIMTHTHHIQIKLKRPNQLYIYKYGDLQEKKYYLNEGKFTVYDQVSNYYGSMEVPVSVDKALDYLFEKYDIKTSLANILYTDLDRRIPPKSKGYYFGISNVDDIACHHIGFASETQEYQVWIEQGKRPLIRKFIIIDKTEPSLPRSGTILRWKLHEKMNQRSFVFDAPKKAMEINITPIDEWEAE
jgi:hypothetical protein